MKVAFTTIFVVGATLTQAIALADPNAEPEARITKAKGFCGVQGVSCARDVATCGIPGNPCARLKRSAEAVADALAIAEPRIRAAKGFCGVQGVSCAKARRSIQEVGEAVEEAVTNIYAREADANAEPRIRAAKGFCGVQGVSCARRVKRDAAPDAQPEADAEAEAALRKAKGFCGPQGVSCAKVKRDADADADPMARIRKAKGFCGVQGVSCARDADPEADPALRKAKGFCGPQGVSCAKSKRDADADADPMARIRKAKGFCGVQGVSCAKVKRDAEAEARIRKAKGFCGVQGVSCARDVNVEEEEKVARSIDSIDPEFFKRVRDAEDGEGTALRAAHAAFLTVKREAEAIATEATPFELLSFCDQYDCSEEDVATIAARAAGTFDERDAEACNAPGGACDVAKRQLDEIEAKLTAAVEAL